MYQLGDGECKEIIENVSKRVHAKIDDPNDEMSDAITIESVITIVTEVLKEYSEMATRKERMARRRI